MTGDDGGAVLELEHLAQTRDVVGKRVERELRRSDLEAVCLEALDDAAPAGAVGPGAMDKNDVRPAVHFSPTPFVELRNDEAIPPDAERQFAERMGATTVEVPSSHVAMLSHPQEVTDLIEKAAEAVGAAAHS